MRRLSILAACLALLGIYMFWVEPYWIRVTHHDVKAPVSRDYKILHLTDLHTRGLGRRERRIFQIVDEEKPDAIVISGDSIIHDGTYDDVRRFYKKLSAPGGVWVTRGNWENAMSWGEMGPSGRGPGKETEAEFYRSTGVHFLNNEAAPFFEKIWIVGVDDSFRGRPDFKKATESVPSGVFRLGVFHSPEYFDQIAGAIDLVLAGHTHGGQVRLPGLPPFYCPPGCGSYVEGWYERGGSSLYVSRGVGTSILDARLFCRPEVAVFTLRPGK